MLLCCQPQQCRIIRNRRGELMKQTIAGLILGLAASAGVAQAADRVTTTNFDVATLSAHDRVDLAVLSDTGSTASLSMAGLIPAADFRVMGDYYSPTFKGWFNTASLQFDVRDGYRITALTIDAKVTGALYVTPPPAGLEQFERPFAKNSFYASWTVDGNPAIYRVGGSDIDGSQPYSSTVDQLIAGRSVLQFSTSADAGALSYERYVCTDHCWYDRYPAFAAMQVSDVVMTLQIAAVPEPTMWMLLLGGLGLVGAVARRRKA
ncbi:PEP-CTERM sorting domain-containing protein [Pseudoduganella plicata]|uniref:PEP-CTERM sorting domain-containing protein n=2 Tax=Pseudoduganella plicata TaxID=321984 RepID=A0ABX5SFY7_9BURK|nr:PEP-CTERM sorting domain-containing protein [Pseudoduganella plicata]